MDCLRPVGSPRKRLLHILELTLQSGNGAILGCQQRQEAAVHLTQLLGALLTHFPGALSCRSLCRRHTSL